MITITFWVLMGIGHPASGYRPAIPPTSIERYATREECSRVLATLKAVGSAELICIQQTVIKP